MTSWIESQPTLVIAKIVFGAVFKPFIAGGFVISPADDRDAVLD
jgi:hypothetical protein